METSRTEKLVFENVVVPLFLSLVAGFWIGFMLGNITALIGSARRRNANILFVGTLVSFAIFFLMDLIVMFRFVESGVFHIVGNIFGFVVAIGLCRWIVDKTKQKESSSN